jgi:hypothetical protein
MTSNLIERHGHVVPLPDGSKARCGGPGLCRVCKAEQEELERERQEERRPSMSSGVQTTMPVCTCGHTMVEHIAGSAKCAARCECLKFRDDGTTQVSDYGMTINVSLPQAELAELRAKAAQRDWMVARLSYPMTPSRAGRGYTARTNVLHITLDRWVDVGPVANVPSPEELIDRLRQQEKAR